jgi:hypothetical protein
MLKKKIIDIPAVEAQKKEIDIYQCDFCAHESNDLNKFCKCTICERLVCRSWMNSCTRYDPYEPGDYPDRYCPVCYALRYEKYQKDFEDADNSYYNTLDVLKERIKRESLAEAK